MLVRAGGGEPEEGKRDACVPVAGDEQVNVSPTKIAARANRITKPCEAVAEKAGSVDKEAERWVKMICGLEKPKNNNPPNFTSKGTTWFKSDYTSVQRFEIDDGEDRETSLFVGERIGCRRKRERRARATRNVFQLLWPDRATR